MIVLENADIIEGDATNATEVDFTIHGLDNNALKQLSDGQLAAAKGTIYTADSTDVISSIILVNTGAAHNHVNLYLKPSGGTSRRLIAKDLQLESGYSLHFDGAKMMIMSASGGVVSTANVDDTAIASSWDGVTAVAPSKNAVYDASLQKLLAATGDIVYASAANTLAKLAKGTEGQALLMGASDIPEWGTVATGGMIWTVITADPAPAVNQHGYMCNTTGGAFTVTLDAAPADKNIISILDAASTFNTFNLTIGRAGKTIMGLAENMTVSTKNVSFSLIYSSTLSDWRIL